jgi:hypothetical protein
MDVFGKLLSPREVWWGRLAGERAEKKCPFVAGMLLLLAPYVSPKQCSSNKKRKVTTLHAERDTCTSFSHSDLSQYHHRWGAGSLAFVCLPHSYFTDRS